MVLYNGWYLNSPRYMSEINHGLSNQLQVYHAEERFNRQYTVLEETISSFHYDQEQEVRHSLADFALKLVLSLRGNQRELKKAHGSRDSLDTMTRKVRSLTALEMLSRVWMGQKSRYQLLHVLVKHSWGFKVSSLLKRGVHRLGKLRELIV